MRRRVLITGIGVVSPVGIGVEAFWKGLTARSTGLAAASGEVRAAGVPVVGAVTGFAGARYLQNERQARVLNRSFELLVGAGALAAADAGLSGAPVPPHRLGVVVGLGPIDQYTPDLREAVRDAAGGGGVVDLARLVEAARHLYPLRRLRLLPNVGPAVLSIEHKAMGPSLTFVGGHTSSLHALAEALALIRTGRVDAVLCGGVDSRLTPLDLRVFSALCPVSPSPDPDRACRPFDRQRNGVVPGEGAAMFLLEAEDSATTRRVDVYGELVACAFAAPTEGGCAESMRQVMRTAPALLPEVVVAHGDGGVQSDRLEAASLDLLAPRCITSLQPAIGHTMSACGAFTVAAACLILADERVPAIRSLESPEMPLPFAIHEVRRRFGSVLTNAIDPDSAASSALVARA
jgi:3-oxoacyl-[acyl-carrier-protein] synthase II